MSYKSKNNSRIFRGIPGYLLLRHAQNIKTEFAAVLDGFFYSPKPGDPEGVCTSDQYSKWYLVVTVCKGTSTHLANKLGETTGDTFPAITGTSIINLVPTQ